MFGFSTLAGLFAGLLLIAQPAQSARAGESACSTPQVASQGRGSDQSIAKDRARYEQLSSEAERLRQRAAAAGAEWLKTEGLLTQSRQQAENGNWNTSLQLVHKACLQAELALQQAKYESRAWKRRVVK